MLHHLAGLTQAKIEAVEEPMPVALIQAPHMALAEAVAKAVEVWVACKQLLVLWAACKLMLVAAMAMSQQLQVKEDVMPVAAEALAMRMDKAKRLRQQHRRQRRPSSHNQRGPYRNGLNLATRLRRCTAFTILAMVFRSGALTC